MVWHIASENDCRKPIRIWNSLRRPHAWLENRLAKRGIAKADVIVAQTEDQMHMLQENFGRRVDALIRNFHPESGTSVKPADRFTVVWVANFKPLKRPELFLEIASHLKDLPHIEFLMVGQTYSSRSLHTEFDQVMRQTPNIKCLGAMAQEEVNALLEKAHLLVNTSKWEGFSNTFIQAWMRAVPVLTLGVNPDRLLDEEKMGRCLESTAEIARSIRDLAANPDMLRAMGQQSRQFAIRHFSMENASELADLLVQTALRRNVR
jgi:glycosyltransferase involved in cell wall biosynthesis